jgi:hypothetical protein
MGIPVKRSVKLLCGALLFVTITAFAADSCTVWMWQKAGLYWRKCVDSKGVSYCQEADDANGKNARTVVCK